VIGGGIAGTVAGREVRVGSPRFVSAALGLDAEAMRARALDDATLTPVWIAVDGMLVATAGFGDPVRHDSRRAIDALRARGWEVRMLSGDSASVCEGVGRRAGVSTDHITSEATPEEKRAHVAQLGTQGPVVMVGDGVNDAAAMATATVGVAVHGGAEAAMATADAYCATAGLMPIVSLVDGARRTMRVVRRNIAFSLAYNVVGIALAMTGTINPVVAAVMMPLSSLTVVAGAWYGRTFTAPR
jgi:Cu2+-exporting ATPase